MPDNVISIYSTRAMHEYVAFEPGVARYARETFFPESEMYDTDTIDIDIVSGGRPIACMVKRYEDGNLVEDKEFETRNVKTGYMNEFKVIETSKFKKRKPGEGVYNHTPPSVQAQQAESAALLELIDRQNRAEEIMAVQALTKGTFTGRNKDGEKLYEADFRIRADHKPVLTGTERWDDPSCTKNKIMNMVQGWIIDYLQKHGGKMPDRMTLGRNAFKAFLGHIDPDDKVSGVSSFRVFRGEVTPRMEDMGVFFLGKFPELANLEVVGYNEFYDDPFDGGKTKSVFPTNTALLCTTKGKYKRMYGKVDHLRAPDFIERFPYIWETPNGKKRQVQLESAPILAILEPDTILSATVTQGE
jgi:hypothetical protein